MDFNNIIAFYFENAGRQKILHFFIVLQIQTAEKFKSM